MSSAALKQLGSRGKSGLVLTKYGHSQGPRPGSEIMEASHPIRVRIPSVAPGRLWS